jgi:UDP-glucose-4-epimerase GalE
MMSTVLVTGAAGFIGSHFARAAHEAGLRVIALDDLSTSVTWPILPDGIMQITGDASDRFLVGSVIGRERVDAVVHFAGRIRVDESVREPAIYFEQNLTKTIELLDTVAAASKLRPMSFLLSSSAAVYGHASGAIAETASVVPISPYGVSKLAAELVLESYGRTHDIRWAALRYFNAAGAHSDGSLRERHDPETHLIPLAIDAALGKRPSLMIHGDDYETADGTCERDYVHVMDLAEAHLAALTSLDKGNLIGPLNLGSERGWSVREVMTEVARAVGRGVPHEVGPRRAGDPSRLVAGAGRAWVKLGWGIRRELGAIVEDALRSRS